VELKSTRANPLIGRREVHFELEDAKTPSRLEMRRELAVALKTDPEKVWIRRIDTRTGTHVTTGLAHVYDDVDKALKMEPEHIIKRNQPPQKVEGEKEPEEKAS